MGLPLESSLVPNDEGLDLFSGELAVLAARRTGNEAAFPVVKSRLLYVGCGNETQLPEWLPAAEVIRLDIDSNLDPPPDIVADMRALGDIGLYDIVFCCHALEHLYPHEVPVALREFLRVLRPGGTVVIAVPDLEGIQATNVPLMLTASGWVCGLDLLYGLRTALAAGNPHMAHHTGFVRETLDGALREAGFANVVVRRIVDYNLLAHAIRLPEGPVP